MKKRSTFISALALTTAFSVNAMDQDTLKATEYIESLKYQDENFTFTYESLSYDSQTQIIHLHDVVAYDLETDSIEPIHINRVAFTQDIHDNTLLESGHVSLEGIHFSTSSLEEDAVEFYDYLMSKGQETAIADFGLDYLYNPSNQSFNANMLFGIEEVGYLNMGIELGQVGNVWSLWSTLHENDYEPTDEMMASFNPFSTFGLITFNAMNIEIINDGSFHYLVEHLAQDQGVSAEEALFGMLALVNESPDLTSQDKTRISAFVMGDTNTLNLSIQSIRPLTFMELMAMGMTQQVPDNLNELFHYSFK